jgi:hypothetical protein
MPERERRALRPGTAESSGDATVDQVSDRSKTDTCAKRTLGSVVRTGALLMGAVLASILMVDLPTPAGLAARGETATRPYVPASDTWIELGAPARSRATPFPELQPELLRFHIDTSRRRT